MNVRSPWKTVAMKAPSGFTSSTSTSDVQRELQQSLAGHWNFSG